MQGKPDIWQYSLWAFTRTGQCRWGAEDTCWFLTNTSPDHISTNASKCVRSGEHENHPDVTVLSQRFQRHAHKPTWHACLHNCTHAHMHSWTGITWESHLTFRAHDEVVNIRPRGHARSLTALFNHTLWGNHLYVDNLFSENTAIKQL